MSSHPHQEMESGWAHDLFHIERGQGDAAPTLLAEALAFGALCHLVSCEATLRPPCWEKSQATWRGHMQVTSQLIASTNSGTRVRN